MWEVVRSRRIWSELPSFDQIDQLLQSVHRPHAHVTTVKGVGSLDRGCVPPQDPPVLSQHLTFRRPTQRSGLQAMAAEILVIRLQESKSPRQSTKGEQTILPFPQTLAPEEAPLSQCLM